MSEIFPDLSPESRVWIYQADRAFSAQEAAEIGDEIRAFVGQWQSHREKVAGDGRLIYDRFILLAADEEQVSLGGCSIDGTVRFIKDLGTRYNVNFFDRFFTCYIDRSGQVEGVEFETFKTRLAQGLVSDDTIVFNNLVKTMGEMQEKWQQPLSQSWHSKFLSHQIFRL